MNQANPLAILPTDGIHTCLWKTMYGKNWMSCNDVVESLKDTHYSAGYVRLALRNASKELISQKVDISDPNKNPSKLYRLNDGVEMPEGKCHFSKKKQLAARASGDRVKRPRDRFITEVSIFYTRGRRAA